MKMRKKMERMRKQALQKVEKRREEMRKRRRRLEENKIEWERTNRNYLKICLEGFLLSARRCIQNKFGNMLAVIINTPNLMPLALVQTMVMVTTAPLSSPS